MLLFSCDIADKPLACAFGLSCDSDIFARFSLKVDAPLPVKGDILYELEGIHEPFVVFGEVGCHLERGGHDHIYAELVGYGAVGM